MSYIDYECPIHRDLEMGATPLLWQKYDGHSPEGLRSTVTYQFLRMINTHRLFSIRKRDFTEREVLFHTHVIMDKSQRFKGSPHYEIAFI